jgi:MoaA/NifB/PqqE/SkfB family radical SAM enzyme
VTKLTVKTLGSAPGRALRVLGANSGWRTPLRLAARGLLQRLGENRPLSATFFVTERCNVRCDGCVYYENQDEFIPSQKEATSRSIRILERIAEEGIPMVAYAGGEPFLRRDLGDLLRAGQALGISQSVITNAMKLHDEGVEAAEACCDSVVFSPHPASELLGNNTARKAERAWTGLAELRRRLKRPELICAITLGRHTAPVLDEIIRRAVDLGVDSVKYQPNFFPQQFPRPGQIDRMKRTLEEWSCRLPDRFTDVRYFLEDLDGYFAERPKVGCTTNRRFNIGVFLDGTVSACCAAHVPIGNLFDTPIGAMLDHRPETKPDCFGCHRLDVLKAFELCGNRS